MSFHLAANPDKISFRNTFLPIDSVKLPVFQENNQPESSPSPRSTGKAIPFFRNQNDCVK